MQQVVLKELELVHFKNHSATKINLNGRLICIIGDNGMGKTNLLDAIYILAMCKSYTSAKQGDIIQDEMSFVRLVGIFEKNEKHLNITLKYPRRGKKTLSNSGKNHPRLKDHIGTIPVVFITPDDVKLLLGGSVDRRAFVNNTLCQIDPVYLDALTVYNHILKQKSSLLKSDVINDSVLGIYNEQLVEQAKVLHLKRKTFFETFSPIVASYYDRIADHKELLRLAT